MASIVGKRRGKRTYYYLVESARVDGEPRIVSQQYLGTAEEVLARLSGTATGEPVRTQHKRFGDLAAVWSVLDDLDVTGVIDAVVPRRVDAGASVGTYIALAVANRIVDPCSKRGFADWWATTAAPRWVHVADAALDHRRFWDAMDALGEADLRTVEAELGRRMVTRFGLDLQGLVLDMTNFATFIGTGNTQAPIAQRGKAKQHRTDLRLVGLALVVTRDGGVPIVSHAYPGDRPDVTQFSVVIDALVARYRELTEHVESLTVVYDAGQNSPDNHAVVEASGIGFVGSLAPSDHFGRRILFTNRDAWPVADVVAADRSPSEAEAGFRQLKDPHVVSFSPVHHWADQKLRVHVFCCVLALAVAQRLRRHAEQAGLRLSMRELLAELAGIQETVLLYHDGGKGRPRAGRILTDRTPTQQALYDLFALDRYAPTR